MKDLFYESEKDASCNIFVEKQKEYAKGRLHFHRAFELAYIFKGSADYIVEDDRFLVDTDHMFFSHCYYRHNAMPLPKHEKYVIIVPENFSLSLSSLLKEKTLPPLLEDKEFNKTLLPIIEKLHQGAENMSQIVLKGYTNIIFGSLFEHYSAVVVKPKNKNVSQIAKILSFLDAHYMQPLTIEETASQLGYNKSYFSRLFNHCVGTSFNSYLNSLRLDKFEEIHATSPKKSMTELAFECGFSSLATFYRVKKERANGKFAHNKYKSQ